MSATVTELKPKAAEQAPPTTIAQITEPGVYDIPAEVYHKDPVKGGSLSSSGARRLLPPSCPALFWHDRTSRAPRKKAWDFGTAAHSEVLGNGAPITVVDAADWRTKAAKEQRAEVEAAGGVAVLPSDYDVILAMAAQIKAHPTASALLRRDRGAAERTLVWRDYSSGIWCRALLDWLPHETDRRIIVADYKTTHDASPEAIAKSVEDWGYHQQAPWYLDGIKALGLHGGREPAFVFVFQQKSAPYLVTVVELDPVAMRIGEAKNRRAREVFRDCMASGRWPGYSDAIEYISLPAWAEKRDKEEYNL